MNDKLKSFKTWTLHLIESASTEKPEGDTSDAPWIKHVALLTGLLAALAGFLTVRTTSLTNDAIYQSNQAILAQAQASDAWAEYQADSIKARILETELVPSSPLSAADKEILSQNDGEIRQRQLQSKQTAVEQMQKRDEHFQAGLKRLGEKDILGYASLAAQLGIALASVAAMSRRRIAFYYAIVIGLAAIVITAYAFIMHGLP